MYVIYIVTVGKIHKLAHVIPDTGNLCTRYYAPCYIWLSECWSVITGQLTVQWRFLLFTRYALHVYSEVILLFYCLVEIFTQFTLVRQLWCAMFFYVYIRPWHKSHTGTDCFIMFDSRESFHWGGNNTRHFGLQSCNNSSEQNVRIGQNTP